MIPTKFYNYTDLAILITGDTYDYRKFIRVNGVYNFFLKGYVLLKIHLKAFEELFNLKVVLSGLPENFEDCAYLSSKAYSAIFSIKVEGTYSIKMIKKEFAFYENKGTLHFLKKDCEKIKEYLKRNNAKYVINDKIIFQ